MAAARMGFWSSVVSSVARAGSGLPIPRATITMVSATRSLSSLAAMFRSRLSHIRPSRPNTGLLAVLIGLVLSVTAPPALASPAEPPAAFTQARLWLDTGRVPEPGVAAPDAPPFVAVILRLNGRVVGMGKSGGTAPGSLEEAMARALKAARADEAVRVLGDDALSRLTLELELGQAAEPLVGATFEQAIAPLQPAMQGLALRHGEAWAYLPASHVLARGMAAPLSRSVLALLNELRLPPRDLPELRAGGSTALYAVPCQRWVQATPHDAPQRVMRLAEPLPREPLPSDRLARATCDLADYLARQLRGPASPPQTEAEAAMRATLARLGLRGTYQPIADEHLEVTASPADQALVAFALARAGELARCPSMSPSPTSSARTLLAALEAVEPGETPPLTSPAACALSLLADATLTRDPAGGGAALSPTFRTAAAESVARTAAATATGPAPQMDRALALAAAAASQRIDRPVMPREALVAALAQAWTQVDRHTALVTAPWLLLAERELGDAGAATRMASTLPELDIACEALVTTQAAALATAPEDAWGAYVVLDASGARATAQSARPMLFLAWYAPTVSGQPSRRDALHASLRAAARFLAQLQAGPACAYTLRAPDRAFGGVMQAPYDPTQHPAAQGMALLALVETAALLGPTPETPQPTP